MGLCPIFYCSFLMITGNILEKEIKILWVSYPILVRNLKKFGAHKKWSVYIRDRYVDLKNGTTKDAGKTVRLRSYGWEKFEITVKTKVEDKQYKVRHENNIKVPSLEAGKIILHMMWFECKRYKEKIRVTYTVGETFFDVDFYDDMPPVLEIEWTDAEIQKRMRKLRLQNHTHVTRWAKKLFKHYGQKVQKMNIPMNKVSMR